MLTKVEREIATDLLEGTDDPNLAILAIVLRRLFPKIAMERLDMYSTLRDVYFEVIDLDAELQKET